MGSKLAKKWWPIAVCLIAVGILLCSGHSSPTCKDFYRDDLNIKVGSNLLQAEAANTSSQQTIGLGGRTCIGPKQAMLFSFNKPGFYPFWMKDMKFNIDMVWVDSNKQIVYVQPNVSPDTYPQSFVNPLPAKYVLELGMGQADELGLQSGYQLTF